MTVIRISHILRSILHRRKLALSRKPALRREDPPRAAPWHPNAIREPELKKLPPCIVCAENRRGACVFMILIIASQNCDNRYTRPQTR